MENKWQQVEDQFVNKLRKKTELQIPIGLGSIQK